MRLIEILVFIIVLSTAYLGQSENPVYVWSDNFEDGDYNDWRIRHGSFRVENGSLFPFDDGEGSRFLGAEVYHESSGHVGSWSFDIIGRHIRVWFIATTCFSWNSSGYHIEFGPTETRPHLDLYRTLNETEERIDRCQVDPETNIHHIQIDRTSDGFFRGFVDDELAYEVYDGLVFESNYFIFQSHTKDCGIDNITVNSGLPSSSLAFPAVLGGLSVVVVVFILWEVREPIKSTNEP